MAREKPWSASQITTQLKTMIEAHNGNVAEVASLTEEFNRYKRNSKIFFAVFMTLYTAGLAWIQSGM